MNQTISVRLTALSGVGKVNIRKQDGNMVECIAIPIDANFINKSANGDYYLNLVAWESDKLKDGKTHLIKISIPESVRNLMTREEIMNLPILGDVKKMEPKEKPIETFTVASVEPVATASDNGDDLPDDMFS